MSESGSLQNSQSSVKSSLKGWATAHSAARPGDIDVSRDSVRSQDSYNSTQALRPAMGLKDHRGSSSADYPAMAAAAGRRVGIPASSPDLHSGGSPKGSSKGGKGGSPMAIMDDQLKRERIWWSEQTWFEVQKMELSVKQELQKTVTNLREQFTRQLEVERNDDQLRAATLQRSIERLREDVDGLRCKEASAPSLSDCERRFAEQLAGAESSLRMELQVARASLEDSQRQQAEDIAVRLDMQQSALDQARMAIQQSSSQLREEMRALESRASGGQREARESQAASAEALTRAALEAERASLQQSTASLEEGLRALERRFESAEVERQRQHMDLTASAAVISAARGPEEDAASMTAKVEQLCRLFDEERLARRREAEAMQAGVVRERSEREVAVGSAVEEARRSVLGESQRATEELSASLLDLRRELSELRARSETLEARQREAEVSPEAKRTTPAPAAAFPAELSMEVELRFQELETAIERAREESKAEVQGARASASEEAERLIASALDASKRQQVAAGVDEAGETVRDLVDLLEAEVKARKSDVDDLRRQITSVESLMADGGSSHAHEALMGSLAEMDMRVQGVVHALETEREARRTDTERLQMNLSDANAAIGSERKLRTHEIEKLRSTLADLALNMQSSLADEEAMKHSLGISAAMAALRGALDKESLASAEQRKDHSGDPAAAQGEVAELLERLGSGLRKELGSRIEAAAAELRAEMAARAAELRADIAASCADLNTDLQEKLLLVSNDTSARATTIASTTPVGTGASAHAASLAGVEKKAEVLGQLSEVLRLIRVVTSSSEVLAERICDEASQRRAEERRIESRILGVERRLNRSGIPPDTMPVDTEVGAPQHSAVAEAHQEHLQQLQQQSMLSEDLKDSLEKLVGRVNRMLRSEEAPSGSCTPMSETSYRGGLRTPASVASSAREASLAPYGAGLRGPSRQTSIAGRASSVASDREAARPLGSGPDPSAVTPKASTSFPAAAAFSGAAPAAAPQEPTGAAPSGHAGGVPPWDAEQRRMEMAVQELKHENSTLRGELGVPVRGVAPQGPAQGPAGSRGNAGMPAGRVTPGGTARVSPRSGPPQAQPQHGAQAGPSGASAPRVAYGAGRAVGPCGQAMPGAGRGAPMPSQAMRPGVPARPGMAQPVLQRGAAPHGR